MSLVILESAWAVVKAKVYRTNKDNVKINVKGSCYRCLSMSFFFYVGSSGYSWGVVKLEIQKGTESNRKGNWEQKNNWYPLLKGISNLEKLDSCRQILTVLYRKKAFQNFCFFISILHRLHVQIHAQRMSDIFFHVAIIHNTNYLL